MFIAVLQDATALLHTDRYFLLIFNLCFYYFHHHSINISIIEFSCWNLFHIIMIFEMCVLISFSSFSISYVLFVSAIDFNVMRLSRLPEIWRLQLQLFGISTFRSIVHKVPPINIKCHIECILRIQCNLMKFNVYFILAVFLNVYRDSYQTFVWLEMIIN